MIRQVSQPLINAIILILGDTRQAIKERDIWLLGSWISLKARYARTVLGLLWYPLSNLVFCIGLYFIFSSLFNSTKSDYLPYLLLGFVLWNLISSVILDAPGVYRSYKPIILGIKKPLILYNFCGLGKHLFPFLFGFASVPVLFIFYPIEFGFKPLQLIVSIPVFVGILLMASCLLSVLCTRYHDIEHIVKLCMRPVFLLTPILWHREHAKGELDFIVDINPFYHLIELVRAPMLGLEISSLTWVYTIGLLGVVMLTSAGLYSKSNSSISKWL